MMGAQFTVTVEVVPPAGPDIEPILSSLVSLAELPVDCFSVATNPVAKPRLSALAMCARIQQRTGRSAVLHCTTRDHNRLSLQGLLWGARALEIETVLVMTGDFVALGDQARTSTVRDVNVFDLVRMARETGLHTGVAFEPSGEPKRLERAIERLKKKIEAGAQFAVTQPIYDPTQAELLAERLAPLDIPVMMGILPLRTLRHAEFLHHRVAGITIPKSVRDRIAQAKNTVAEGVQNAREMLAVAREHFAGVCIMPPFDHYELLSDILA